ncbi:MAG: radical SAM family heme chaperone HemW [Oscillospiraceae bacterium]
MTGLYIHIPFCMVKCDYCAFYSLKGRGDLMDAYCSALNSQFRAYKGVCADTVFFGGGTPSLLGSSRLSGLLRNIFEVFNVQPLSEISLEANPESSPDSFLAEAREAGFNRVSLGVQSFIDSELKSAGRVHDASRAIKSVLAARKAGFDDINADLIYGLPGQTMETWRESIRTALSLPLTHMSLYALTPEPGTRLYERFREADGDLQADMYLEACALLADAGFIHYEVSNWAKPGFECRHNLKYWRLEEYLGFGPAAASDFGGRRFTAAADLESYLRCPVSPPLSEDSSPDGPEREKERLMLSLRTADGIETGRFLPYCEELAERGLGQIRDGRFRLTDAGFLLSNSIIGEFWDRM